MARYAKELLEEIESWSPRRLRRAKRGAERALEFWPMVFTPRRYRKLLLAAACGADLGLGEPAQWGEYNYYISALLLGKPRAEEVDLIALEGIGIEHGDTIFESLRAPRHQVLCLARRQARWRTLAPSHVKEVELPEHENRVARWIGKMASRYNGSEDHPEDPRILVRAASEALELDENSWEVLEILSEELGRMPAGSRPWSTVLSLVVAASQLNE